MFRSKPFGEAGLAHQRLRLVRVVGVRLQVRVEADVPRRDGRRDAVGVAVQHRLDDAVDVGGVVDRLAELLVVQRRLPDLHHVVRDAVAGRHLGERPTAVVDRVDLLDGDVLGDVDLAGAQRGRAGRQLGDRLDPDLLDLRRAAPILLVRRHRPVLERVFPLVELVRAGAVRLVGEDLDALGGPLRRDHRHREAGHPQQQGRVGLRRLDVDGVLVDDLDAR